LSKKLTLEEKRAQLIIRYRNLTGGTDKPVEEGEKLVYRLNDAKGNTIIMHAIIGQKTIGISYVRDLKEAVDKEGASKGILVGDGKYTYSARSSAETLGIELIPPTLPTFDIFQHALVPKHEIISEEEVAEVTKKYHAEPFQLPWIKMADPIAIILGAKRGDILKITQKSATAGTATSYRYVV
jgi:DNA-directed RNA polymerase subunit H (RpoH/RPB5)